VSENSLRAGFGAPFRVGAVMSRTFAISGASFGKFFVLAFVPMTPLLLLQPIGDVGPFAGQSGIFIGAILGLVCSTISQATCLFGAFQLMRDQPFSIGESLRAGLARAAPVIGVGLVSGIFTGLAALLLIVPGIIVGCMLYVSTPACVIERLGVMTSLRRSRELTAGFRWQIFGLVLIVVIASFVVGIATDFSGSLIPGRLLAGLFDFVGQILIAAFGAVLAAVVYHDLRVAKEGVDIEKLANVFD